MASLPKRRTAALGCLLLASRVAAQQSLNPQILATNYTNIVTNGTQLTISRNGDMIPLSPVLPLTQAANSANLPPPGLSGQLYADGQTNYLNVSSEQVAFISCDAADYFGMIDAVAVYREAVANNVSAVLLYSTRLDGCSTTGDQGGYEYIYSMLSSQDARDMLNAISTSSTPLYVTLGGPNVRAAGNGTDGNGTNNNSPQSTQQNPNPLGRSPSTAVAMIILYSITGVITALFLIIIITGAIRAHRHPERYGPRAILGRPRQSRARGVGRAILDTIPIVKFGERDPPKPNEVELELGAAAAGSDEHSRATAESSRERAEVNTSITEQPQEQAEPQQRRASHAEEGISAAAATGNPPAQSGESQQGCSICTDDFELGQDQRVLPCDHRFHPECIDPWLLNVSGTCPLCRIDLRPAEERTSDELDEHGNPIPPSDELDALPPPITAEGESRGSSVRRSLMLGILGIGRPDRLTREERVLALRRYRLQQATQAARRRRESAAYAAQAASEAAAAAAVVQTPDSSTRSRLRSVFGIRTRRTGQAEEVAEQPASNNQPISDTHPSSSPPPPGAGNGPTQ